MQKIYARIVGLITLIMLSFSANALHVHINPSRTSGCAPLLVNFNCTASGATSYHWSMDGYVSGLDTASHTFSTPGAYTVTLTVDSASVSYTDTVVIQVYAQPDIHFIADDTSVCPGVPITFTDISIPGVGGPVGHRWDFGDGTFSTSASPSKSYTVPGFYTITLIDTSSAGCISAGTVSHFIHIFPKPSSYPGVSTNSFCNPPANVTINNYSSGSGLTYRWALEDTTFTTTSTGSFTRTYSSIGTHVFTLTLTDINGCTDTNGIAVRIYGTGFRYDTNVCLRAPETFIDTSTGLRDLVTWTFGDGATSHIDPTVVHTYTTAGIYNVTMTVHFIGYPFERTCSATHSLAITPFTDSFTITPIHPCPEQDTLHYNAFTHYGDTIRWQFGDHGTAMGDTVTHIFYPGALDSVFHIEACTPYTTYILNRTAMYVTDIHGCRDTIRRIDTTYNMLFEIKPSSYGGCVSLTDTFSITTRTTVPYLFPPGPYPYPVTSYSWNFGDGSSVSTTSNPVHTFTAVGSYSVTCTITTNNGCTFKDTIVVTVGTHTPISYTATPTSLCYGGAVTFTADTSLSTVHIDHLVWDYGDGAKDSTGIILTATHEFLSSGNLPVKLTAYNRGCPTSFTDTIKVHPPQAVINVLYDCNHSDSFVLQNLSVGATSSFWLFPDGSSVAGTNTSYHTTIPAVIKLVTYNSTLGCRDTAIVTLTPVNANAIFTTSDTTICGPALLIFNSATSPANTITQYNWLRDGHWVQGASAGVSCDGVMYYPTSTTYSDSFTHAGIDTVMLIVTDIHGCIDTFTRRIFISDPIAGFTFSPTHGCWPLAVHFTDTSIHSVFAPIDTVRWFFGDGAIASSISDTISHLYTTNTYHTTFDTFKVKMVITDAFGCKDSITKYTAVQVNHPVAASYSGTFCPGNYAYFSIVNDPYSSYRWDYGNGIWDSIRSAIWFYHQYYAVGDYTVKLVVTDSIGCKDSSTQIVHIVKPHAAFSTSDTTLICPPFTVNFTNASTSASSYIWDLGDGSPSFETSPTHTYNSATTPGVETVMLIAQDYYGCRDTAYQHLHFLADTGSFTYPGLGCSPLTEYFTPTISSIDSLVWEFGDLTTYTSTASTPISHVYNHPGVYVPIMRIYKHGCSLESHGIDSVKVDSLHADFNFSPNPVCPYSTVTFHDASTSLFSTANSWHWSFSSSALTSSPTYTVGSTGPIAVTMTVSTVSNCTDTETHAISVYGHLLSAGTSITICSGSSTTLTATGGSSFHWYPSTGLSCTTCASPNAHPTTTTTYTVTGINSYGCNDTATVTVSVNVPSVSLDISLPHICFGQSTTITASGASSYSWAPSGSLSAAAGSSVTATPTSTTLYTVTGTNAYGCISTALFTITVYSLPVLTVTATPSMVCPGQTSTLSASGASSYSWSPSGTLSSVGGTPVIATPVTTTVYSVTGTDLHGCSSTNTVTVTVSTSPDITLIGNTGPSCNGENIMLYDSIASGTPGYTYSWTGPGGYTSAAHNPILTAITTAMNGWYILTVTDAHGCSRKDSTYVNSYVLTPFSIIGDTVFCQGASTTLTASPSSGLSFSWSPSSSLSCAACAVTNAHPTTTTTYTVTEIDGHGCVFTRTKTVVVYPLPVIPPIQGDRSLCVYQWTNLSDSLTGGTWTASGHVEVMSALYGLTEGMSAGTGTVTYTYTDVHGCTNSDTFLINVHPLPVLPPIIGDTMVCLGSTAVYTDSLTGGYWATADETIDLVDSSGHLTTVDTGYGGVIYFYTDTFGCQSAIDMEVYIAPSPILDGILQDTVCQHDSTIVVVTTPGGVWTSGDSSIATISPTGFIIGVSAGTTMITYTVTNSLGCSSEVHNFFTVIPLPDTAVILGMDSICVNSLIGFTTSIPGGVWSSSDPAVALVDSMGVVSTVDTGTVTISYTVTNWHCSSTATYLVHVITTLPVEPITGDSILCVGSSVVLTEVTTGGFWVVQYDSVATVDSFGLVTGISPGTTLVGYLLPNACGYGYAVDTIHIVPPSAPITGIAAVCSGSVTTLSNIVPGGEWSSSNTDIATVDPATGVVTGVSYGTVIITYTATTPCGSFSATINVMVDMAPIITTNFLVACQTMSDGGVISSKHTAMGEPSGGGPVIEDGDGCLKVCENTTVRYYGHGVAGSHFTWTCIGGTIVATYGANADSIDVLWPAAGVVGSIIVNDTFSHCIGQADLCIKVISKPQANFTASTTGICLGDAIAFFDASVADTLSPIAGWYWDFGDGTSFGDQFPPPHVYGSPGVYYVTLVVWNACHCADTFRLKVSVEEYPGPQIHCPAIVCENEIATYSIDDPCDPEWVVFGGTIIDGDGTGTITVQWDDAPADGHGYVQVTNTCGDCNLPTIVQVPIILNDAPITGPGFACVGTQYTYSLPLWAATDYEWGVLGFPGIIMGANNDRKMTVVFPGPGTYTIHAWYQNRLKLCGGNVTKTVVVKDAATISGPTRICVNDSAEYNYTLSGGHVGVWTVRNPFGVETTTSGAYSGTSVLLNIPGVWLINAIGDFCVSPVNVYVDGIPTAIDSVVGEDTVCLNRIYTYKAYNDVPGTTYEWQAIGGNVLPASGSETVDVVWTSAGTKKLMVRHEPDAEPHCDAPLFVLNITQEEINPAITGDTAPCANAHRWYNSHYSRGDAYDWSIYPDSVGSVVAGYHSQDARVLWNNVVAPTTAYVIVKTQKCDTSVSDSFRVTVQPPPPVYITTDTPVICPGNGIILTSHGIMDSCIWDFGDGTSVHAIGGAIYHLYPDNSTSDNRIYTVRVTPMLGADPYCPTEGTAFYHITVLPGPLAYILTDNLGFWCPPNDTAVLHGMVTDNIGALTYVWYRDGSAIPLSNDPDYTAHSSTGTTAFHLVVTAANGCTDTSNTISIVADCDALPGGPGDTTHFADTTGIGGGSCPWDSTTATISHGCNTITLTGSTPGYPTWYAFRTPNPGDGWVNFPAWSRILGSSSATAHYDLPGIYKFAYVVSYLPGGVGSGCRDTVYVTDTVGVIANFRTSIKCGPGNTDSVFYADNSSHLSWWHITTNAWNDLTSTGSGPTFLGVYTAGSVINMTETVSGTESGNPFSCSITKPIHVPTRLPHFGYTFSPNNICSELPVTFTPATTAGVASFLWQFGNDGTNRLISPKCSYSYNGSDPFHLYATIMTVTDTIGCTFDTSMGPVTVYKNDLNGIMDLGGVVCPSDVPYSIGYFELGGISTSYAWSNGDSTFVPYTNVYNSGAYTVKVYDVHQCRFVPLNVENVKVLRVPTAQIRGRLNYCTNEMIQLNGYAGHSVGYHWYIDGASLGPLDHISFYEPTAGTYTVTLVLSLYDTVNAVECTDTAIAILHVLPAPDAPVITGPVVVDCDLYHLQLSATASEAGTFNWSNSAFGPVADVYTGGPISVTFTNMAGCTSSAQIVLPSSPGYYFQYLPTGCYDICKGRFPITLYGPPNVSFDSWEWRKDGTVESSGSGIMDPYSVGGTGEYQWVLGNSLCRQKSDVLDITAINCDKCDKINVDIKRIECSSTDPAVYTVYINLIDPYSGDTYTVGTDGGPLMPFSGVITSTSTFLTLSLAVIDTDATSVTIYVELTHHDGTKCLYKKVVSLPDCSWIAEKPIADTPKTSLATISTAMLVYPNPATQMVTISYDYGEQPFKDRNITVFDPLGRRIQLLHVDEVHGNWQLNTTDWMPGMYIIRMEGDGKALQTQRLIVNN